MTLRQVADAIEMHESTVSRVTSNKYLSCARGAVRAQIFLHLGDPVGRWRRCGVGRGGEERDPHADRRRGPKTILSDDTLVDLLKAKGFDIARRTVAKYREAMGIGSSVQRRRQKTLGG